MKPSTRKQLEEALFRAISQVVVGGQTKQVASARAKKLWEGMLKLLHKYHPSIAELMSVSTAAGVWAKAAPREPTEDELQALLEGIKNMPYQLRSVLKAVEKEMPRKPGGGRKKILTPEQERDVCSQVGALYANGVQLPEAFKRVARQFKGVSARTIKRTWENRGRMNIVKAVEKISV